MTSQIKTRTDRTRDFFKLDDWNMDAADAWQHIVNGAGDDDDLHGYKSFSALDLSDMFNEYRAFEKACNDAFAARVPKKKRLPSGSLAEFMKIALSADLAY